MRTTFFLAAMTAPAPVLLAALCLSLVALNAAPAAAQESPTETEARRVFEAGEVAFRSGHYGDALGYFKRAHELSQRPALLFNIALCADRLRDDDAAIDAYQRYLAEVPLAANRREVDDRLDALHAARTRREAAAHVVQPAHVAQAAGDGADARDASATDDRAASGATGDSPAVYETWWFWTIVGVVVVGGAVGIGVAASGDEPYQSGGIGGVVFTLGDGR